MGAINGNNTRYVENKMQIQSLGSHENKIVRQFPKGEGIIKITCQIRPPTKYEGQL